jgi:hypothetical protein
MLAMHPLWNQKLYQNKVPARMPACGFALKNAGYTGIFYWVGLAYTQAFC